MFPLDSLGWDAAFAAAFDQLQDDNLLPARVAAQHRGEYVLFAEEGELRARAAGRMFHDHEVGGQLPAVGDWVGVTPPATITAILERRSAFIRKTAGKDSTEQVLAANVDTAFLLAGLDDDFSLRRLERYITSAWESGAAPIVVLTKADLCPDVADAVLAVESVAIGVPVHPISNVSGDGLDALEHYVQPGRTVVLLGSSGVGKSTLLNRLAGEEVMRTRAVAADGTGRHTTTHRELFQLPGGGLVVDTPGLRELQFWEGDVSAAFEDIEALGHDVPLPRLRARKRARLCRPRSGRQRLARARPASLVAQAAARARNDRRTHRPSTSNRTQEALEGNGVSHAAKEPPVKEG